MSDIFLSYAREDQEPAKRLTNLLQQLGWTVFWDLTIRTGKPWHQVLDDELNQARCVIVMWSMASIQSKFVRDEAQEGMDREILLPHTAGRASKSWKSLVWTICCKKTPCWPCPWPAATYT